MNSSISKLVKLTHKQFRAMLKKFRRKKKRQLLAREREAQELLEKQQRENSPSYKEREKERQRNAQLYDEFEERERLRRHKMWLLREEQAQIEFKKKQDQLELEKIKREEERKRILAEFEQQQYLENKAEEENQKLKSQKEEALQEALSNLPQGDGPWHNPIAPANYNVGQEREQCQFFAKTGCCRFGDRCSRGHIHPSVSTTILIRGMYSHISIGHTERDDFDTDSALEYEDKEMYQDFKNFYYDVLPEFKKIGKVIQFKVCSNHEPHLRGNVYVQFSKEEDAVKAYQQFHGRFYAGRQLTCEFTNVIKWKSAICGLFFRKLCPKGINCNFLHVFKNPNDEFWEADRDLSHHGTNHASHSSRSNHSRYGSNRKSYHDYSSERRRSYRDDTSKRRSDYYYHRDKSLDSDNRDENGLCSSSREKYSEKSRDSSRNSHYKKRRRDSHSRSRSNSPLSDDATEKSSHERSKHKKKKKSKKSKREKDSDRSENHP